MAQDSDKLKGPGGLSMRQIHEAVKQSQARDRAARDANQRMNKQNRWQRFMHYVWDKRKP